MTSQPTYTDAVATQVERRERYGSAPEGVVIILQSTRTGGLFTMSVREANYHRRTDPSGWRSVTSERDARMYREARVAADREESRAMARAAGISDDTHIKAGFGRIQRGLR